MPTGLLPHAAPPETIPDDPEDVVEAFLEALAASEPERAVSFLDEDVEYVNVGLPTVRGRDAVENALGVFDRPSAAFEVYLHAISADGPMVLTERTDVLVFGPFRAQFWVWGRFDVHDGRITLWRDSFDYLDLTRASLRALAGIAMPRLRPAPPQSGDAPGR